MASFIMTVPRGDAGRAADGLLRAARVIPMQRGGNLTPAYRIFRDRATREDRRMTVGEYLARRPQGEGASPAALGFFAPIA